MLKTIASILALWGTLVFAQAQQTLADLAAGAGVDWLAGSWEAQKDNGETLLLEFKADLNNRVGQVHYKDSSSETRGLIVVDPASGEPKYFAGDSRGSLATGVWSVEDRKAVLKCKMTDAEGKTTRLAFTFGKVDGNAMEVKVYSLSERDELGDTPGLTLKFTRKK